MSIYKRFNGNRRAAVGGVKSAVRQAIIGVLQRYDLEMNAWEYFPVVDGITDELVKRYFDYEEAGQEAPNED